MYTKFSKYLFAGTVLCLTVFLSCTNEQHKKAPKTALTKFVDPFIGTAAHGHVYPGATLPFGMVQLSPDNGTMGWDWCSGYNWEDDTIVGFSHTHLSGTGIGDLYDISLMPTNEVLDFSLQTAPRESKYAAVYSHDNEKATPGYYSVQLDNGIYVELTTTDRVGFHHYRFPSGTTPAVLLDLGFAINWDKPLSTAFSIVDNKIIGHRFSTGWARDQRIYFAIEFSQKIKDFQLADSTFQVVDFSKKDLPENADLLTAGKKYEGTFLRAQVAFDQTADLYVKVGISHADQSGALAALEEVPDWNFESIKKQANQTWEEELSKIKINSSDKELSTLFYTSLYHTYLAPVISSDANGNYKASTSGESTDWSHTPFYPNGAQTRQAKDYRHYDIFSLWDTFRAAHPLFTLTQKERVNDFINSILAHYDEYGYLPVWSLLGNETNTMTGYHAIPVITDAYQKGFKGFDAEKAFVAMKKSAMQNFRGTNFLREYGYIPHDKTGQSVTRTLEYAYDDWCIAQMAKALNKQEDYAYFMKRATAYQPLFDASTGFMRAKLADGRWKSPFDPQYSSHDFDVAEYTEGNAWQHSWFVPHDVAGMIQLHGGSERFVQKLDSLFSVSSEIKGDFISADISGLIGQYAHGNEPSHHISYLYNYAGMPWKTQEKVTEICHSQYNTSPSGLCGNEDCGQMSAWYVFSAMGFYPVNPASGIYVIGSPLLEEVNIAIREDLSFKIQANQLSSENIYIQSASLNGQPLERSYILHDEIMNGGVLTFEMGPAPNKKLWSNSESVPPSMTK